MFYDGHQAAALLTAASLGFAECQEAAAAQADIQVNRYPKQLSNGPQSVAVVVRQVAAGGERLAMQGGNGFSPSCP